MGKHYGAQHSIRHFKVLIRDHICAMTQTRSTAQVKTGDKWENHQFTCTLKITLNNSHDSPLR